MTWVGVDVRLESRPGALRMLGIDVLRILWNSIETRIHVASANQGTFQLFEQHLVPPFLLEEPSSIAVFAYSSKELWGQRESLVEFRNAECSSPLPYFNCIGSSSIEVALSHQSDSRTFRLLVTVYEFRPII